MKFQNKICLLINIGFLFVLPIVDIYLENNYKSQIQECSFDMWFIANSIFTIFTCSIFYFSTCYKRSSRHCYKMFQHLVIFFIVFVFIWTIVGNVLYVNYCDLDLLNDVVKSTIICSIFYGYSLVIYLSIINHFYNQFEDRFAPLLEADFV